MVNLKFFSHHGPVPLSPFKFRVLPTHDASKVRASGPGLTSGVPASFPVEFNIDTKDAGQGQLSVLITVSNPEHTLTILFLLRIKLIKGITKEPLVFIVAFIWILQISLFLQEGCIVEYIV